jgi:hypothetical protein
MGWMGRRGGMGRSECDPVPPVLPIPPVLPFAAFFSSLLWSLST